RGGGGLPGPGHEDRLLEHPGVDGGRYGRYRQRGCGYRSVAERLHGHLGSARVRWCVVVGGQLAVGQVRPPLVEGVVARLSELGGQRGRGGLGLVVVIVVGDPLHRVRLGAGDIAVRGEDVVGQQGGGRDDLSRGARRHRGGEREVVVSIVVGDGENLAGRRLDRHDRGVLVLSRGAA